MLLAPVANAVPAAILWAWLCWHLHYAWSLDEQYRYGWAVPLLAGLLFYLRWQHKPAPAAPRATAAAAVLLLALLLPIRVVEEANPDWRLLSWILALVVVAYSLLCIYAIGGESWLRHFAFPVCFVLVAVPWLVQFENFVVQTLTRAVAATAVEIAGWLGIGAFQIGNVIQLRNGFVGVDEACSGVRTLQSALMVSLFLGEVLRLGAGRRVALVAVSCGWVFVCNVARAGTLVIIAAQRGFDALHSAHDVVGTVVMVVGLAGILVAGWMLRRSVAGEEIPARPCDEIRCSWQTPLRAIAAISWLAVVFAASELWYHAHEQKLVTRPEWHVSWPTEKPGFNALAIPESTRSILRFDAAESVVWRDPRGVQCWAFFARWNPGRTALQLVRSHSPDICLPAIGRTFERELPSVRVETAGTVLPFRVYEFTQQEKPLFVFVCIQDDKLVPGVEPSAAEWSARGRLLAAWHGRRNLGQRLLELAIIGPPTAENASVVAAELVREIVR